MTGSDDASAIVWDMNTGEKKNILRGHTSYISVICISNDNNKVITGSNDKKTIIWNL